MVSFKEYFLTEYNQSGAQAALMGTGGKKAAGKSADAIAAGGANPYKTTISAQQNHQANKYPNIMQLIKKVKEDAMGGDTLVTGPAMAELNNFMNHENLQQDENNEYIIPFAKNIRLKIRGNAFFLGPKTKKLNINQAPQPSI